MATTEAFADSGCLGVTPSAYVSFDTEMDGTNPLQNSLRSLGLALFVESVGLVDTFYINVLARPGAAPNPGTMRTFWSKHPAQWQQLQENPVTAEAAMAELARWLQHHGRTYTLKWVARPACVDWMFLKCYYESYGPADKPDIGHYCHCLATMLRTYFLVYPVRNKKPVLKELSEGLPYNHNALVDAICQGTMYMNLRKIFNQTKYQFYD